VAPLAVNIIESEQLIIGDPGVTETLIGLTVTVTLFVETQLPVVPVIV